MKTKERKDQDGRVLLNGETQRKDGLYEFRFYDRNKKRHSVYAKTLKSLREKEQEIEIISSRGRSYLDSSITVLELVQKYVLIKRYTRYNTKSGYNFVLSVLEKQAFGKKKIRDIKVSDAKIWLIDLYEQGYKYSTVASIRGVVKPAFQMAYEDDIIIKNPFNFKLDIIPNDTEKRIALSKSQQEIFLNYIKEDAHFKIYYNEILLLLKTGMRVSEMCGLTLKDIDWNNRRICVDHQLIRKKDGTKIIEKTKTESGCRYIPMSDEIYNTIYKIISDRKKVKREIFIDGYVGFILLDKNGQPKVANHIQKVMHRIVEKYNKDNDIPLPHITPHVLRHTFCTNMVNAGMGVKSLQYLMGHADIYTTLGIYAHSSYEKAEEDMLRIVSNI